MKKQLLTVLAVGVLALTGCSNGEPEVKPIPPAPTAAEEITPPPSIAPAPTEVPEGKEDGTEVPVEEFVAPLIEQTETIETVYTEEEMVEVAKSACEEFSMGAMEADVITNIQTGSSEKAAAAGVDVNDEEVVTLISSGLRSYCPEFQIVGASDENVETKPSLIGPNGPDGTPEPAPEASPVPEKEG